MRIQLKKKAIVTMVGLSIVSHTTSALPVNPENSGLTIEQTAERALLKTYFQASQSTIGAAESKKPFFPLFGAKVNGLDSCDGNISFTIQNIFSDGRLRQIYERFQDVLDAMMSKGGAIFLGSLYVQKSNPGLYSMVTNGINIGVEDFLGALGSCESMLEAASSFVPESAYEVGKITKLENAVKDSKIDWQQIDITQFFKSDPKGKKGTSQTSASINEKGDTFYNNKGEVKSDVGGSDPSADALEMVRVGAMKGYCIMRGIKAEKCTVNSVSAPDQDNGYDITKDPMFSIYFPEKNEVDRLKKIVNLAYEIFGEVSTKSCDTCSPDSIVGKGLYIHFTEQRAELEQKIRSIMNAAAPVATVTSKQLNDISAPLGVVVDLAQIKGLEYLEKDPALLELFINGLAMDVAYARVLWIGRFYSDTFNNMAKDELVLRTKKNRMYETLRDDARANLNEFREDMRMQEYAPGQYNRLLLKLVVFEGDTDQLQKHIKELN